VSDVTISPEKSSLVGFDYAQLDPELAGEAQAAAERIRELSRTVCDQLIEIGKELIAQKRALGHGHFGDWLRAELDLSQDTAERLMRVATRFGDDQIPHAVRNLSATVLYALASPSMSDDLVKETIERAERGEQVTTAAGIKQKKAAGKNPKTPDLRIVAGTEAMRNGTDADSRGRQQPADNPKPKKARGIPLRRALEVEEAEGFASVQARFITIDAADIDEAAILLVERIGADAAFKLAVAICRVIDAAAKPSPSIH
jgi:hypothetical protein